MLLLYCALLSNTLHASFLAVLSCPLTPHFVRRARGVASNSQSTRSLHQDWLRYEVTEPLKWVIEVFPCFLVCRKPFGWRILRPCPFPSHRPLPLPPCMEVNSKKKNLGMRAERATLTFSRCRTCFFDWAMTAAGI